MSGRVLVGGVAAAGAAYYLYESSKAKEIHQPKNWPETKISQMKGDTVGAKVDKGLAHLQKDYDQKKSEAKSWASEQEKKSEEYWKKTGKPLLKEKINESGHYLNEKIDAANSHVGGTARSNTAASTTFKQPVKYWNEDPNKSALLKLGDKYIDSVNGVAFAVHDGVYAVRDGIFGKRTAADDVQDKASQAKKDATSWFNSTKKDAKAKGKELESEGKGWFNSAKAKGNELEKKEKGWFGSADKNAVINDVSRGYGENTSFWAKEQEQEQKGKLQSAKDSTLATLGSAKEIIDKKAGEVSKEADKVTEQAKPWFGLKTVDQRDEERLDKLLAEVSRGYGENATFFAQEAYDDIANQPVLIQELRDKAKRNLDEAKVNFDKSRTHWWSWASQKDKELEKATKEQWENAKVFYDDVEKKLVVGNAKFKEWSDSAISTTKTGLDYTKAGIDYAHDKTQEGLTKTQDWLKK